MTTRPGVFVRAGLIGDHIVMTTPDKTPEDSREQPQLPPLRAIKSEEILQGNREIRIVHEGEVYRLLVTRNGKLILQK